MELGADGERLIDGLCVRVLGIEGKLSGYAYRKNRIRVFSEGQDLSFAKSGDRALSRERQTSRK